MLTAGTQLGPYEVLSQIGAGGMGEVYRARDANLGRDVAIKVLPEAFVRDSERMARFGREGYPTQAFEIRMKPLVSRRALVASYVTRYPASIHVTAPSFE